MPDTNFPARSIIKTFITKIKMPSVSIVIGNVSIINIGFTIAFKKARTKANTKAVIKELIFMCGVRIIERPYATAAVIRSRIINFILKLFRKAT